MMLYSSDWQGSYADNFQNLAAGNHVGYWDVDVERAGTYRFTLSRWHPASGAALDAALSSPIRPKPGKAVPIAKARLRIGGEAVSAETVPGQKEVRFTVKLKAGKTRLETWFLGKDGAALCSAYYTKVERI